MEAILKVKIDQERKKVETRKQKTIYYKINYIIIAFINPKKLVRKKENQSPQYEIS